MVFLGAISIKKHEKQDGFWKILIIRGDRPLN